MIDKNVLEKKMAGAGATLVGVWQAAPTMGAGWSDAWQFFPDGSFQFHGNQMDGTRRLLSSRGSWRVEAGCLALIVLERIAIEGGEVVDACPEFPEGGIRGGVQKLHRLDPAEKRRLSLTEVSRDEALSPYPFLELDGRRYFRLRENPNDYD